MTQAIHPLHSSRKQAKTYSSSTFWHSECHILWFVKGARVLMKKNGSGHRMSEVPWTTKIRRNDDEQIFCSVFRSLILFCQPICHILYLQFPQWDEVVTATVCSCSFCNSVQSYISLKMKRKKKKPVLWFTIRPRSWAAVLMKRFSLGME